MRDLRLHVIPLTNQELDTNGNPLLPYAVTAEEFADLVAYILGNTYLNGETIRLDGATRLAPK